MSDDPYPDSKTLAELRAFVGLYPALEKATGPIAQFKIVIDANMAISDLLYKHKHPHISQTAIEEVAKSSAVELHAPVWLNEEMVGSTIPQVSRRKGIPEPALHALWAEYKKQIVWDDQFAVPEDEESCSGDSKDVPYVALQESLSAVAILSRDKDIDELGGKRVDLEFVLSVRSYARAATCSVGIRVGGTLVTTVSIAALVAIVRGIESLISRLPDWLKIALFALAVFVAVHPEYRERAIGYLKSLGRHAADLWPEIERLIDLASEKQLEAENALGKTEQLLGT